MAKKPKKKLKVKKEQAAERVKKIWPILRKQYPDAKIALTYKNPWQLLVAVILSAQCTDVRVNKITPGLFKKYKTIEDWAEAATEEIEKDIHSAGFYRNKAKNIKGAADKILSDYGGKVPDTMEELLKLPGVGRKTANCILGNAYNTPGIVCDTHVIRLSRRIGLSENSDPVKLEYDLNDIVPRKNWTMFSHLLIFHGRITCNARKPDCPNCTIARICPSANNPELW